MTTISSVVDAFRLFYDALHQREFRKTLPMNKYSERDLQPMVRTLLLGYFGHVSPEVQSRLPGGLTGYGSIDFVVGDVAIEFAVRRPWEGRLPLSSVTNSTELRKLLLHKGKSLLVLYDFSKDPFSAEDLNRYREWQSLGKGNHKRNVFHVAYFYKLGFNPIVTDCVRMMIRP